MGMGERVDIQTFGNEEMRLLMIDCAGDCVLSKLDSRSCP